MKRQAFTLMELMVVVVIIGIIAGFALPQYQRAIRKSQERDGIVQLTALNAGNVMYFAKNNAYLPTGTGNLAAVNAGLNMNIIANGMVYAYNRPSATTYTATAFWDETVNTNDFTLRVNEGALGANNPCCVNPPGQCPTRPNC